MEYRVPHPMQAKEVLASLYPDSSRRTLKNWLASGRFLVNGRKLQREDEELQEGALVTALETFVPAHLPGVSILYQDRALIAIEKPSGLLSVPLDDEGPHRHALGLLRAWYKTDQIFPVHRIDREASGLLIFARGLESRERLKELFKEHALHRQYFAVVEGRMSQDAGAWENPLLELPSFDVIPSSEGKMAVTHFQVLHRSAKYSYLRLVLETGKKHQIRVHCQQAGHPILGDKRYGALENSIRRLALHAEKLELIHPFTGKSLSLHSPLPPSFSSIVPLKIR
ncbi:MAG: RluA family pseudouridine synthase [Verrucomicrobiota bacterium]|nr:RluA family pseudouridine synthase [Verrucomicrobiota bacterium]